MNSTRCGAEAGGLRCDRELGHLGMHRGYIWGFERTACSCDECIACCKRQPGSLAPGEFERIEAYLKEDRETAKSHFWASPGAVVGKVVEGALKTFSIGTITPRMENGRCVFLNEQDRCRIWPVAPFGCAMFDTHMSATVGLERGSALATSQMSPRYQSLRNELPKATTYRPTGY